MREKNIKRAAHALYLNQGDDKNKILSSFIEDKEVRKIVKDQGRALTVLEKLILPHGQFSFEEEEVESKLYDILVSRGHRIQGDEEEDTEEFLEEKRIAEEQRLAKVPTVLDRTVEDIPSKKDKIVPEIGKEGFVVVEELPVLTKEDALKVTAVSVGLIALGYWLLRR